MSQLIFIMMSIMNSVFFMKMKHPMSMGIILLMQTIYICIITGTMSQNTWFSYILFLVFLGGMLVLFIYMTSVASNEMFQTGGAPLWMLTLIMIPLLMLIDPTLAFNNTEDMYSMDSQASSWQTSSMFNYPNNIMTIVAVLYLFLTLIVVVKITESHQGPLRSTN